MSPKPLILCGINIRYGSFVTKAELVFLLKHTSLFPEIQENLTNSGVMKRPMFTVNLKSLLDTPNVVYYDPFCKY